MSMIQIPNKAATREEMQSLLDQTYALFDPLGTPTIFHRPEDFITDANLTPPQRQEEVEERLRRTSGIFTSNANMKEPNLGLSLIGISFANLTIIGNDLIKLSSDTNNHDCTATLLFNVPNGYNTGARPSLNVIYAPKKHLNAENFSLHYLGGQTPAKLSGAPEEWQFNILWHEIAHGLGGHAGEPQVEAINSVMCRRACGQTSILHGKSDLWALNTLLNYDKLSRFGGLKREKYGYPCVEIVDYMKRLPSEQLDAMSEEQIIDLAQIQFDPLADTVRDLGEMLIQDDPVAFKTRDYATLAQNAHHLLQDYDLDTRAQRVLSRFQLACIRAAHGEDAYDDASLFTDKDVLESERADPLTFEPESYIPGE